MTEQTVATTPEAPVAKLNIWDFLEERLDAEQAPDFFSGDTETSKGILVLGPADKSVKMKVFPWNGQTEADVIEALDKIEFTTADDFLEEVGAGHHAETIALVDAEGKAKFIAYLRDRIRERRWTK